MTGGSAGAGKDSFLSSVRDARLLRQEERARERAALVIQTAFRGYRQRLALRQRLADDFDRCFPAGSASADESAQLRLQPSAVVCFRAARLYWRFHPEAAQKQSERLERLCRYILASLSVSQASGTYIGVALNKECALPWIEHMRGVLSQCSARLERVRLELANGQREAMTLLRMLVSFSSTQTWALLHSPALTALRPGMQKLTQNWLSHLVHQGLYEHLHQLLLRGLAGPRVWLSATSVAAALNVALKPVLEFQFAHTYLSPFLLKILSVPGLLIHLEGSSPESLALMEKHNVLGHCVELLKDEQQLKIHFNILEGSYALCMTANLIHLLMQRGPQRSTESSDHLPLDMEGTVRMLSGLFECCGHYVTAKQSNLSHWHPVLGWFSVSLDSYLQHSMDKVHAQLAKLWSWKCINSLSVTLQEVLIEESAVDMPNLEHFRLSPAGDAKPGGGKQMLLRALEKTKTAAANHIPTHPNLSNVIKLDASRMKSIGSLCALYRCAMRTLSQIKLEILSSFCYQNRMVLWLWQLIQRLGPHCGLKQFMDQLSANPKDPTPQLQILILFADCMSYVITLVDDLEMYEKQEPLRLVELAYLSHSMNQFLFRGITSGLLGDPKSSLFQSLHALLMVLYGRDNRRGFCPTDHWLIKEIKLSTFLSDLDKGKKPALLIMKKMPHVIPRQDRVQLFRKQIAREKQCLGILTSQEASRDHSCPSTLITVHRGHLVEDGYRQLATLSRNALKGIIRVKFVNEQGLDEAGIDQDGVFKEFLEETIKKVFDPTLNLFCATTEERLYPSPTSSLTDNHLELFDFVGKMIGKAVYEGIVVDVPFAPFFLSQVLGKDHSSLYSYIDELPSLDQELYKNLTFIKHLKDDVSDLDLTFAYDQDMMGKVITHELVPGGRAITVTNANKISYIHHVAHFRMHQQILDQVSAFTRGFFFVIQPDWLHLFSTPEVQHLISGDSSPLDVKDLRRHTHYYGGFHDSHRVIGWFWDILDKDFTDKERGAFLKFVTSCSKPPLLGFEHLEPPFSIRCVEVADEEDDGDTLGSVIRGFLALRRRDPVNRLPTASTCFNLLKLPNYQKKSTLKEKLRYAISCNTGFELS